MSDAGITIAGGLRARLIFDSIQAQLISSLTALGWLGGTNRRNQPVRFVSEAQDVSSEVPINTVALSDENVNAVSNELGSAQTEDTRYYYIDFFAESDAVGKHLIGDLRDVLLGKLPSVGPAGPVILVYDYRPATPVQIFSLDVTTCVVDRSHIFTHPWMRHWYSIQFSVVDYYTNSAS